MEQGAKSTQAVRNLQKMLRLILNSETQDCRIVPNGIYGPETAAGVMEFQARHGIPQTGITDYQTWEAVASEYENCIVDAEPPYPLSIIMPQLSGYTTKNQCSNIALAQAMLSEISKKFKCICPVSMSGTFDSATEQSVVDFQSLCALPEDGCINKNTWKHLVIHYPHASLMD